MSKKDRNKHQAKDAACSLYKDINGDAEVIGNIYDNPELLNNKNEK